MSNAKTLHLQFADGEIDVGTLIDALYEQDRTIAILRQHKADYMEAAEETRRALEGECERLRVKLMVIASAEPARHGIEWAKAIAAEGNGEPYAKWREAIAERDALAAEISNLHTTMMAAAVEIQEHWPAHCDEDGYGPNNLMYRLENGIAAQYGYTAQTIVRLESERDALAALTAGQATVKYPLTVRPSAYAVFADNGNVICFSTQRDHQCLVKLEEEGKVVVALGPVVPTAAGQGVSALVEALERNT